MEDVINRLKELERKLQQLFSSKDIPREVEVALRERLGLNASTSTLIKGVGTMVGGILDITDPRITSSSVCTANRNGSSSTALTAQLSTGYLSGTTIRIFEGNLSANWTISYIIAL